MAQMKLYYWPQFRSVRCIWLIKELGVEADFEYVKIKPKGPDTQALEQYAKNVHPHGLIPALQVEGRNSIVESGAICLYLAQKYGRCGPDDDNAVDYYNWIVYATVTLDSTLAVLFSRFYLDSTDYNDAMVEKALDKWKLSLDYLTKTLSDGRDYICGSKFSAADCVLGYSLVWAEFIKKRNLLAHHPVVVDYLKRLYSRSAFQASLAFE